MRNRPKMFKFNKPGSGLKSYKLTTVLLGIIKAVLIFVMFKNLCILSYPQTTILTFIDTQLMYSFDKNRPVC